MTEKDEKQHRKCQTYYQQTGMLMNLLHNFSVFRKIYCKNYLKSDQNHFMYIICLLRFSIISANLVFLNYLDNADRICIKINCSATDQQIDNIFSHIPLSSIALKVEFLIIICFALRKKSLHTHFNLNLYSESACLI